MREYNGTNFCLSFRRENKKGNYEHAEVVEKGADILSKTCVMLLLVFSM